MCACSVISVVLTLCDPMNHSPPGSTVHGISQARILEWVAMPSSRGSSQPRDQTTSPAPPALQAESLPLSHQGRLSRAPTAAAKSLQSCPTLCDRIDGRPPGSPVPGILQARTLEWLAVSFSNA